MGKGQAGRLRSALMTLSGVAGSLAERLPILHIVGAPSRTLQVSKCLLCMLNLCAQGSHALVHHTINVPNSFATFSAMSRPISCSQALLSEIEPLTPTTWTDAFDKVFKDVLEQCRPGYVQIPTDAVQYKVSDEGLKKKLVSNNVDMCRRGLM
jgi:pyruvate decarboxylase